VGPAAHIGSEAAPRGPAPTAIAAESQTNGALPDRFRERIPEALAQRVFDTGSRLPQCGRRDRRRAPQTAVLGALASNLRSQISPRVSALPGPCLIGSSLSPVPGQTNVQFVTAMAASLTYLSEDVFAGMVNQLRGAFVDMCGLSSQCDAAFLVGAPKIAFTEVSLAPYLGTNFDGASRVDVVVMLRADLAVPFELKLGTTRLTRTRIDEEWLPPCQHSHDGKRFKGNMLAILERKFPGDAKADLQVKLDDRRVSLTRDWFVVVRERIAEGWRGAARPTFSPQARVLSFEKVVDEFGGPDPFNNLVRELLAINYYERWVRPGPE